VTRALIDPLQAAARSGRFFVACGGTFCIENRCALLHDDRDFAPMEAHLGLVAV